jgi:hypothetical protein
MQLESAVRVVVSSCALFALLACGKSGDDNKGAPQAAALSESASKPGPSCDECRAKSCVGDENQEHLDLPHGCLVKPDPRFVPNPDAKFAEDCRAVVECAYKHDCAYDAAQGVAHCYCGSRRVGECLEKGPADDAPCVKEWQAATRTTDNVELMHRFSKIEYPAGWAFHLLECDRDQCGPRSEQGRCVP